MMKVTCSPAPSATGNQVQKITNVLALIIALISLSAGIAFGQGAYPDHVQVAAGHKTKLTWLNSIKPALAQASRQNKLVLVDLYTDWCGWCKKLDADTYSNPQIIDYVDSRFVCVRMNGEDGGEGEALAHQMKVRGYPCTIIIDPSGNLRGLTYGYFSPADFPGELTKASTPKG